MMLRFVRRNYNAILTATFAFVFVGMLVPEVLVHMVGFDRSNPTYEQIMSILGPSVLPALLALYVLIFSSRLRDEYVEKIWQGSARRFAMVILLLPWLWMAVWVFKKVFFSDAFWLPTDPSKPIIMEWGHDSHSVSQHQLDGVYLVMGLLWTWGPLVFVALFKWHAWRDRD